jgi:excisionase family DNA binding protein
VDTPLDQTLADLLDGLADRIAERAAAIVLRQLDERERPAGSAEDDRLLNVEATAARLAVPVGAVYKMSSSGKLTAVKVGGRLRFRVADIEQLIEQGTRSESRVRALAAAAQAAAGRSRCAIRRAPRSKRRASATGSAKPTAGSASTTPVEPDIKVVTNNDPDAANSRRTGG